MKLHNGRKPLINIKKISPSDAVRVLYMPMKRLIHHLMWWIGVHRADWIPCLELSPTWFLKNNSNFNINQQNNNNNYYDNNNNNSNNNNDNTSNNVIISLKEIVRRWKIKLKKGNCQTYINNRKMKEKKKKK